MCSSSVYAKISSIALIAVGIIISDIDAKPPRRIIGGENADPNEFPWMARLNGTGSDGMTYDCGGAIISPRHVLTAAHCLKQYRLNSVWTGFHIRDFNIAVKSNLAETIVHPQYKVISNIYGAYAENDIGIAVLVEDLKLGANQAVIPLANKETTVGTRGTLSGWGFKDAWGWVPAMILQKSTIDIQPDDQCWVQRSEQLCGRSLPHAIPCSGDSGSPLVVDDRVVGITSSSICLPGRETMFTSVYHHLAWIKSIIEKSSV